MSKEQKEKDNLAMETLYRKHCSIETIMLLTGISSYRVKKFLVQNGYGPVLYKKYKDGFNGEFIPAIRMMKLCAIWNPKAILLKNTRGYDDNHLAEFKAKYHNDKHTEVSFELISIADWKKKYLEQPKAPSKSSPKARTSATKKAATPKKAKS